jgi:hypothetical protein
MFSIALYMRIGCAEILASQCPNTCTTKRYCVEYFENLYWMALQTRRSCAEILESQCLNTCTIEKGLFRLLFENLCLCVEYAHDKYGQELVG